MRQWAPGASKILLVAVYLLLGNDEERKARGVERLRRDRAVESYDAS